MSPDFESSSPTLAPGRRVDADAVIAEEYDTFRGDVTRAVSGKLAASKIRFADLDMDGFYNQAWFGLYTKLQAGETVENRKGLLIQMTYRRAIDEYRSLHPDRQAGSEALDVLSVDQSPDETIEQQDQFRQFVSTMRTELNERELKAATLCYVYGYTRPEAAEVVGVRPKRMEKIMDEVSRKMRPMLAQIKDGEYCESRSELINLYALGALDEDSPEYREAVDHLKHCPGCRRKVLGTRGLTAVTPVAGLGLLVASGALAAGAGSAAAAGTAGSGGAGSGGGAFGGVAQAAAVVAAVGVVAAGAFAIAGGFGGSDDEAASTPAKPAASESSEAAAESKSAPSKKSESKPSESKPAEPPAEPQPQAPAAPPPVEPVQPAPEPEPEVDPATEEFDLQ